MVQTRAGRLFGQMRESRIKQRSTMGVVARMVLLVVVLSPAAAAAERPSLAVIELVERDEDAKGQDSGPLQFDDDAEEAAA